MARKSGWQEFTDNFNSVYKGFTKIGQDWESADIMDDEKFMAKGGLGYNSKTGKALEGTALEKARYKALGDIATKYGNAKDGLEYRQQLSNLESSERENTINQSIMAELINQRGALTSQTMRSEIRNTDADTGRLGSVTANNRQTLAENKATFDARLRSLVANAGLDESNATIKQIEASIKSTTRGAERQALLAEIEKRRIVAEADGNNYKTVSDLNIDQQRATLADTKAGTKVRTATEGSLEAGTKQTEALTAKQVFENARQENFKIQDYAAYGESLDADLEEAKKRGDESSLAALTAQRGELREMALMDFHTFVPETDEETYGTADDQRYDQWLGMIKTFDGPEAALAWQNKHSAEVTGQILADSNRLVAEVDSRMRLGSGVQGVAELMDDINGDGGGAAVVTLEDGRRALVETDADGATTRIIAAAETETELSALVQTMAKPEAAINVAERLYQTKKRGLDTRAAEQSIKTDESVAGANNARTKLINAQVKNLPEELKLTKAQAELATAKADEIVKSMEGLQPGPKQELIIKESLEAIAGFIVAGYEGEDLDKAVADYMRSRGTATSGDGYSIEPAD